MLSEEQIRRFFAKRCTAEEAEQVAAWLKAHPEEASAYLEESDWHNASSGNSIPDDIYTSAWQHIQQKINLRKRYLLLKHSAVAACIAVCIFVGLLYIGKKEPVPVVVSSVSTPKQATLLSTVDTEYNVTNKPRLILMADGSVISLAPKAILWFDTPFARADRRDVHLTGEARFEVAKNKQKPFTVYSGAFSTTALGTEFIVKEQLHNISVQLIHGKVVIKNIDYSVKNWKNVYLLPGQQMLYDDKDALARVSDISGKKTDAADKLTAKNTTQRETADSLIFNGSPMATVLKKLHDYYGVNIQFSNADIKNISFTGVLVKKDSVQTILKAITQMNGLLIEGTDSSFTISKEGN